jgi:hypothetical protein
VDQTPYNHAHDAVSHRAGPPAMSPQCWSAGGSRAVTVIESHATSEEWTLSVEQGTWNSGRRSIDGDDSAPPKRMAPQAMTSVGRSSITVSGTPTLLRATVVIRRHSVARRRSDRVRYRLYCHYSLRPLIGLRATVVFSVHTMIDCLGDFTSF